MATAGAFTLATTGLANNEQAYSNVLYVHPIDFAKIVDAAAADADKVKDAGVLCAVGEAVFYVRQAGTTKPGCIGAGMMQRLAAQLVMNAPTPVTPFSPPRGNFPLGTIVVEVDLLGGAPPAGQFVTIDKAELAQHLQSTYQKHVFKTGQQLAVNFKGSITLKLTVREFTYLDLTGRGAGGGGDLPIGQFLRETDVELRSKNPVIKFEGSSAGKANQVFKSGFNFLDLGIGGLNKEFADIFRRAFASRVVPPDILRKMGQHHVRGMLLFGPPGCGKTLIARQIGKALQAHPPKIVNGPEILNKFVGQSEENIRNLFADAEKEQAERGDESDLHIIIFDEIDAICRQRGTTGGGTGVNDSIVNQLLSKIDGVEALNNILLIGMTNRKDLIDEAIIRPGRLEVHIEVGLPDEMGRRQILTIHTAEMVKNKMLAPDVSIGELAERTKNYTGAEIEGLVKAAASYVFQRQIDPTNLSKKVDFTGVQVSMEDFERALVDVRPAFGIKEDELSRCFANGVYSTGPDFDSMNMTLQRLVHQVMHSDRSPLVSVVLTGASGSGKTAIAAKLGVESGFPLVKRISGENMLNLTELGKAELITKTFNDAYKSALSMVILDDLERLLEYVPVGPRFSNTVLQTLLVLTKALPPPGRRLLIVATTAQGASLDALDLISSFQLSLSVPQLDRADQFAPVLRALGCVADADIGAIAESLEGCTMGVKRLLTMIESAKQDAFGTGSALTPDGKITKERFTEVQLEWG